MCQDFQGKLLVLFLTQNQYQLLKFTSFAGK